MGGHRAGEAPPLPLAVAFCPGKASRDVGAPLHFAVPLPEARQLWGWEAVETQRLSRAG